MLPILRILPVGGVFLAILLLVLALGAPERMHAPLTADIASVRGALIARTEHPEWRQFLMQAAIRRADELSRLRELPDAPARSEAAPPAPKFASVPIGRGDTDHDFGDGTGSILQPQPATIPIDIGEPSAFELPVPTPEEKPLVIRTPQRMRSHHESRVKGVSHKRHAKARVKPDPFAQFDLFKAIFGDPKFASPPTVGATAASR
jgi:hypothetical protein